jgi:hypothetical protein
MFSAWRPLTADEQRSLEELLDGFRKANPGLTEDELVDTVPFKLARHRWLQERGLLPEQDPAARGF